MKRKVEVVNDMSRSLSPLEMATTLTAVVEMSQTSWLAAGIVPGIERQPLKKLGIDQQALLKLLRSRNRRSKRMATRSRASLWHSRPDTTASGWRVG